MNQAAAAADVRARLAQLLAQGLADRISGRIGLAVSGGSDSTALLHLAADWAKAHGARLCAVTVDHGLRPEAADEARGVADQCRDLGIGHDILQWRDWDGQGNLPDQARRARYRLMADWAKAQGIAAIALGHTADDQAETLLMRLGRGSGVDGLAAMQAVRRHLGIEWLRPLLPARREDLRAFLTARQLGWSDDPGNEDPAYGRVQARRALALLAPLGVTVEGLTATAGLMRMASSALGQVAGDLAATSVRIDAGDVVFDRAALLAAAEETRLRLVAHALVWISGAEYRPRILALKAAVAAVSEGRRATLQGCLIMPARREIRITREARAVAGLECAHDGLWDRRWRLTGPQTGPAAKGLTIRALGGDGLRQCPDWRALGVPRATLLAQPAVWNGANLVAAPLAGLGNGWSAEMPAGADDFRTSLIVH
ncbi:MAG: tRNA lysidine(34) synthetase TilS [Albidovulum sp.]